MDRYAETLIAPRISTIDGVAQVQVTGAQKYAVHVQMDPSALATRQIGIDDVENALNNGNVNTPTGTLWGQITRQSRCKPAGSSSTPRPIGN